MNNIPTASQIIAALIKRMGGNPVELTFAELMAFQTKWPTVLESNEDCNTFTVSIGSDGAMSTYFPSDADIKQK